jgi:glycosyltransferase involved in cell wall biosynthesis
MEAFRQTIRSAIPDAKLWMVCTDAPTEPGVEVLGRLTTEQLADRYRRAWVFCLPSSYEGFGVPYIEAMASGTPVVATPNVGAREVLSEGKFGVIADETSLADSIVRLLRNPIEREHWALTGLRRARDFSWEVVAAQYEELYRDLVMANAFRKGLKPKCNIS